MSYDLVSVMMPAYNAETYIRQAIESVLAQSYKHWELIVVDDGSTDRTASIVAEFADPRIRLVQKPNGGESTARNMALRHMRGEFVAFLDADDVYLPDHLTLTIDFLNQNPQFSAVYTDGYYCDSSDRLLKTLASRRRGPYEGDVFAETVRGSDLFGPPVCVVLRRKKIVEHELQFDVDITIGPDWVFLMQYAAVGQFGYIDEYTCLYRIHDTNISLRVDLPKRAQELAKCRMHSINIDGFDECPVDVRSLVFYELLVVLLRDVPEEQMRITQLPQFQRLPAGEQARLLRLLASQMMLSNHLEKDHVRSLLKRSSELDSGDKRARFLLSLHTINPQIPRRILKIKRSDDVDPLAIAPFADIDLSAYTEGQKAKK